MKPKFMVVRVSEPFAVYGICAAPRALGWDSLAEPVFFSEEDAETFCRAYKMLGWQLDIVPEPSAWLAAAMKPYIGQL